MANKPFRLQLNLRIKRLQTLKNKQLYTKLDRKRGVAFIGSKSVLKYEGQVQKKVLSNLIYNLCCRTQSYEEMEISHSSCKGWDEIAHKLALSNHIRIHIHPPTNQAIRAVCKNATFIHCVKPHLDCYKDMIDNRDTLIVVLSTTNVKQNNTIWSTIEYARKRNKRIFLIMPNGALISERI